MGPRIAKQDLALDGGHLAPYAQSKVWRQRHVANRYPRQTHSGVPNRSRHALYLTVHPFLKHHPQPRGPIRWGSGTADSGRGGAVARISTSAGRITQLDLHPLTQAAERLCIWTPQDENKVGLGVAELRMRQAM